MDPDTPRLIETSFPLREVSLDSVHEKNVRHGHISTLHIWPARRPLAACRAALIAALLPDPGTEEKRREIYERMAGRLTKDKKGNDVTEGGILHWGRESGPDLDWFREEILKAYDGKPPRVLDPFAGGGAIPLEAMRLGCDVTAADINPVAWFILKCTLEYPRKLAGKTLPLPDFALDDDAFMLEYFRNQGRTGKKDELIKLTPKQAMDELKHFREERRAGNTLAPRTFDVGLSWHVRAWGRRVLELAKADLDPWYPVIDGKPTVATLWARTVTCPGCRTTIPLLKTRWLCRKDDKLAALDVVVEKHGNVSTVGFQVKCAVKPRPASGQKKGPEAKATADEWKQTKAIFTASVGDGTMSGSGVTCPACGAVSTMQDLRREGKAGRLGSVMTAVVVDGDDGKEYREPAPGERALFSDAGKIQTEIAKVYADIPYGLPEEPTPYPSGPRQTGSSLPLYGIMKWKDVFTPRQLMALGTFVRHTRAVWADLPHYGYSEEWSEAIGALLTCVVDRVADRSSTVCHWDIGYEKIANTFTSFKLPISWDFSESVPVEGSTGGFEGQLEWVAMFSRHALQAARGKAGVLLGSATRTQMSELDCIVTDPPYYDAIPYSDLMDFFYAWIRRTTKGLIAVDSFFQEETGPKWDHSNDDGELIDDPSRFNNDRAAAKQAYENGMLRAFSASQSALSKNGRFVVVFANKNPDAWETLASALIRAGFIVNNSWPIQTEMGNRTRSHGSAALSSSVWLVCRKRPAGARPGWDDAVLGEMQTKISERLTYFWEAGIRGPDVVWSATGPALEAYSRHPVVKKAGGSGEIMAVGEFLGHVRRMVVQFVVGRVLNEAGADPTGVSGLDDVTTYYLLHRHDYGSTGAPAGAVILYALSCGVSDSDLVNRHHILKQAKGEGADKSAFQIVPWNDREERRLGEEGAGGSAPPIVDVIHRMMQLWKADTVVDVDAFIDQRGVRRDPLFHKVLQAFIELAPAGDQERSILESIANHLNLAFRRSSGATQIDMGLKEGA